jgi:hypothetical protein
MLLQRAQGLLFMLIGAISMADAWRISVQWREAANFDAIGPDRYLLALGAVLVMGGAWTLLRPAPLASTGNGAEAQPAGTPTTLVLTLVLLVGFTALMPLLGFSLACLLFLVLQLWLLASWPWWKTVIAAVVIAAAFHVTFVSFADMPLPKASLWN